MKRVLRLFAVLVVVVVVIVAALGTLSRVKAARNPAVVDSWVVPSMHELPPAGFEWLRVVPVPAMQRRAAETLLANELAVPLDERANRTFSGAEPVTGTPDCTPFLVRGVSARGAKAVRVSASGTTLDVSAEGGFRCQLSELQRAPFVACLTEKPDAIVTSFRCEPLSFPAWVLHGSGDRW